MKNKYSSIISIIACAVLVMCLFKIYSLENQISQLENTVNNQREYISRDINMIYNNVDNMLKEQTSLLTNSYWQFTGSDMEAKTANILAVITPKELTLDVTNATLVCNGEKYEMMLIDDHFEQVIPLPLFENTEITGVYFTENGTMRTQKLDWFIEPRYEYLTIVYADMNWSGRGTPARYDEEKIYTWTVENGEINIDIERKGQNVEIQSIYLVEQVNGLETKRTQIPLTKISKEDRARAAGVDMPVPESAIHVPEYGHATVTYDLAGHSFEIPYGGTLQLFIETVDGDGLVHRNQLQKWTVDEKGRDINEDFEWWHGAESLTYDADGNLLYSGNLTEEYYG